MKPELINSRGHVVAPHAEYPFVAGSPLALFDVKIL